MKLLDSAYIRTGNRNTGSKRVGGWHARSQCAGSRLTKSRHTGSRHTRSRHGLRASIGLLAACLILAITSTGLITWLGISWRNQEISLDRHLDLQSSQILSGYDREILERYGLWGYDPATIDSAFWQGELLATAAVSSYEAEPLSPLRQPDLLLQQISTFASTRVPVAVLDEIWDRIELFRETGTAVANVPLLSEFSEMDFSLPEIPAELPGPLEPTGSGVVVNTSSGVVVNTSSGILKDRALADKKNTGINYVPLGLTKRTDDQEIRDEAVEQAEDDARGVNDLFRGKLSEILALDHESEVPLLTGMAADNEQGIISLLLVLVSEGIDYLNFDYPRIVDKMLFQEYVINQFSSEVRGPAAASQNGKSFLTLSGQKMSDLDFTSHYEAESILLAQRNEWVTAGIITGVLASTRLALQFAAILNDGQKMATYQGVGTTLASALALLSLGTVVIDPLVVARVFALIEAAIQMFSDVKQLKQGKGVALFPLKGNSLERIDMFYIDYLRLMGLFVPLEKQATVAAEIIENVAETELSCGIRLNILFSRGSGARSVRKEMHYAVLTPG